MQGRRSDSSSALAAKRSLLPPPPPGADAPQETFAVSLGIGAAGVVWRPRVALRSGTRPSRDHGQIGTSVGRGGDLLAPGFRGPPSSLPLRLLQRCDC